MRGAARGPAPPSAAPAGAARRGRGWAARRALSTLLSLQYILFIRYIPAPRARVRDSGERSGERDAAARETRGARAPGRLLHGSSTSSQDSTLRQLGSQVDGGGRAASAATPTRAKVAPCARAAGGLAALLVRRTCPLARVGGRACFLAVFPCELPAQVAAAAPAAACLRTARGRRHGLDLVRWPGRRGGAAAEAGGAGGDGGIRGRVDLARLPGGHGQLDHLRRRVRRGGRRGGRRSWRRCRRRGRGRAGPPCEQRDRRLGFGFGFGFGFGLG